MLIYVGYLTQWRFIARNAVVLGLHLGVFRPRVGSRNAVDLVAESYIDSLATPNNQRGTWVFYPVDPPLQVYRGDYLGFFYDRLDTLVDLLTIVSNIPPTNSSSSPVAVFLKDASDIQLNRNFYTAES